jgi:hypothetical protein
VEKTMSPLMFRLFSLAAIALAAANVAKARAEVPSVAEPACYIVAASSAARGV